MGASAQKTRADIETTLLAVQEKHPETRLWAISDNRPLELLEMQERDKLLRWRPVGVEWVAVDARLDSSHEGRNGEAKWGDTRARCFGSA